MKQIIIILSVILLGAAHLQAQGHDHIHGNHEVESQNTDSLFIWDDIELNEVNVTARSGLLNMRSSVIQTQKITSHELSKAACCNLSESFTTNPSVDVTYSDAATGSKQIKLLGLSGTYVQMLTENYPNLRGLASTYGLNYIPGPWMEGILLSKGSSSVLNGYESITGQINVEYKKPATSEKLALNLFAGDEGRFEANLTSGIVINEHLATGILAHAVNNTFEIDHNGDGFLDQPKVKQYQLFNRWDYEGHDFHIRAGIKGLYEDRKGGQIKNAPNPYKIGIETNRYEFFLKGGYILDEEKERSIGLIMSGSLHNQDSYYGIKTYDAQQTNLYANFIFSTRFDEHHKLTTGASFNSDLFDEKWHDGNETLPQPFERKEIVPGIFGEYSLNLHDHLTVLLGLRGDYHNLFGFFATPRLHVKYNPSDYFQLRASAGKGYRTPNILAENNYLFASNRKIQDIDMLFDLKQEEAWNYGLSASFDIPVKNRDLTFNAEWYYTNFLEQVVVDMDRDQHSVSFYNLDGNRSYSSSIQLEVSYEIIDQWTITLAHRFLDVKATYINEDLSKELREKPLNSRFKSLLTTSYVTPNNQWQFDFTAQLNGGGRMPKPDVDEPLWDKEFNPFVQLQCQITKNFKTWSVYVGGENLTGFVQQNPIISADDVSSPNFDASMVWGPIMGRTFYIGARWRID